MDDTTSLLRLISPLSPTTRQTTRALQELGGRSQRLSEIFSLRDMATTLDTSREEPQTLNGNTSNHNNTPLQNLRESNVMDNGDRRLSLNSSNLVSHTPSPDEMVIQARGRRQVPLTFSPDLTPLRQQMQRSKVNQQQVNNSRLSLPSNLRMSPRKRLILNDSPSSSCHSYSPSTHSYSPATQVLHVLSPLAKKVKLDRSQPADPATSIKGLEQSQLVTVITNILKMHPDLKGDVLSLLPSPDLVLMEERLSFHKRNIFKALPNTRLESKTDSLAFSRVSQHLAVFKKEVCDNVKRLLEGEQWTSLVDYTVMAWSYVQATPIWDNTPHNNTRKSCFKTLAAACLTALKQGHFAPDQLATIKSRLVKLRASSSPAASAITAVSSTPLQAAAAAASSTGPSKLISSRLAGNAGSSEIDICIKHIEIVQHEADVVQVLPSM